MSKDRISVLIAGTIVMVMLTLTVLGIVNLLLGGYIILILVVALFLVQVDEVVYVRELLQELVDEHRQKEKKGQ